MATVQRAPADKPGPTISSEILTNDQAQVARGTQEINYHFYDRILKTGVIISNQFVIPGSIIGVEKGGEVENGKCTNYNINGNISGNTVDLQVNIGMDFIK